MNLITLVIYSYCVLRGAFRECLDPRWKCVFVNLAGRVLIFRKYPKYRGNSVQIFIKLCCARLALGLVLMRRSRPKIGLWHSWRSSATFWCLDAQLPEAHPDSKAGTRAPKAGVWTLALQNIFFFWAKFKPQSFVSLFSILIISEYSIIPYQSA